MNSQLQHNRFVHATTPWVVIVTGALITAWGYAAFVLPNDMLEGGVTGLGMIANRVLHLPAGLTALAITSVFFVAGFKILGRGFGARTVVAAVVLALAMDAMTFVFKVKPVTSDPLLASFYGGIVCGVGLAMIYLQGAATGGADAVGQILRKLFGIEISKTLLAIDVAVLGIALLFFGANKVMYSLLMIVVEVKVIDLVLHGKPANQLVTIISSKAPAIADRILYDLGRGLTLYEAKGGYSGLPRMVVSTIISRKQMPLLRKVVAEVDRRAFVTVTDVDQCYGEGFDRLPRGLRMRDSAGQTPMVVPAQSPG
jgi:uncharacterized membrane-anchored protein YitT (DUF2179 family)